MLSNVISIKCPMRRSHWKKIVGIFALPHFNSKPCKGWINCIASTYFIFCQRSTQSNYEPQSRSISKYKSFIHVPDKTETGGVDYGGVGVFSAVAYNTSLLDSRQNEDAASFAVSRKTGLEVTLHFCIWCSSLAVWWWHANARYERRFAENLYINIC